MPERLEDAMRQYFDDEPEARHLAESHRGILQEVRRTPRLGVQDLARRLEISPSACGFLVEELISLGYLKASGGRAEQSRGDLMLTEHASTLFASPRARALSRQFCRVG